MTHEEKQDLLDDFALEVKKIEEEAEQIIKDANAKKEEDHCKLKNRVSQPHNEKTGRAGKEREKTLKARQKIDDKKEELLKESKKEIEALQKSSRKNVSKAVDYVLGELDKKIGDL